jgi:hypothetical protein
MNALDSIKGGVVSNCSKSIGNNGLEGEEKTRRATSPPLLPKQGVFPMLTNSVELLEKAIQCATTHGISVRMELLDGGTGGYCRFAGKAHIFLDQRLTAAEQLEIVMFALRNHVVEEAVVS